MAAVDAVDAEGAVAAVAGTPTAPPRAAAAGAGAGGASSTAGSSGAAAVRAAEARAVFCAGVCAGSRHGHRPHESGSTCHRRFDVTWYFLFKGLTIPRVADFALSWWMTEPSLLELLSCRDRVAGR